MIKVYWADEEKTIVQIDYYAPVATWDEHHSAMAQVHELARSRNGKIDIIHNPNTVPMPPGNGLMHVARTIRNLPPNARLVFTTTQDVFARRVVETAIRLLLGKEIYMVASVEEAYERMKSMQRLATGS